ncbi:MAG: CRTAC1 family protein, partial [Acidobacteriota bacterium]
GDLDLYAVQGGRLDGAPGADPSPGEDANQEAYRGDRLFRNDLSDGGGFTDITEAAGLRATGYGMGVAVGDFDNDGAPDLYVLNAGANQLWLNLGDGTFSDVTAPAGVGDGAWSVSATWFDFDGDGWLDLYVANYVDFSIDRHVACRSPLGLPDYCSPLVYRPAADTLYRNLGDGTFEDVSPGAGIRRDPQNGLGVVSLDADGDGRPDLYVANDMTPNHLFINLGDGRFEDRALQAGLAVNAVGQAEASMGLARADVDSDGDLDLLATHLRGETHTLYAAERPGLFADRTGSRGLSTATLPATGFGAVFLDLEHDGDVDLVVANGAVTAIEALAAAGDPRPLHEPDSVYRGRGGGLFEPVPAAVAGDHFGRSEVGRGLAHGDIDNDGDMDLVLFNNGGPLRMLLSTAADRGGRWLGLDIRDGRYGRPAIGARVRVELDDGRSAVDWVARDGSYAVSNDPRRLFGLGAAQPTAVEVTWPDGWSRRLDAPEIGRYHRIDRPEREAP